MLKQRGEPLGLPKEGALPAKRQRDQRGDGDHGEGKGGKGWAWKRMHARNPAIASQAAGSLMALNQGVTWLALCFGRTTWRVPWTARRGGDCGGEKAGRDYHQGHQRRAGQAQDGRSWGSGHGQLVYTGMGPSAQSPSNP